MISKVASNNFIDLKNKRFGRLVVLKKINKKSKDRNWYWFCKCDCGNFKEINGRNLRRGTTKSCGCLKKEQRIKFKCAFCGEESTKKRSQIEINTRNYCSRKCYFKHKKILLKKQDNPNWKGGISVVNLTYRGVGNKLYRKGKYYENVARKELEKMGYYVTRSAASKGLWDLIAVNPAHIRFIQIKVNRLPPPKERKKLADFECPDIATKEYWRFYSKGKKQIWTYRKNNWIKTYG